MKKITKKQVLAMVLSTAMLVQSGSFTAFAAAVQFSDERQPLVLTQLPFTEAGVETERASEDTALLEIYNTVKSQAPTLSEDGSKLVLPATGNDNYEISLYGSSNKAVIDMEGHVTQPLEDMQVYLYYRVRNVATGEELHMDDPVLVEVNGLYEDSQSTINRPQIMPGIREWKGNEGEFTFGGNIVIEDDTLAEAADVVKSYIEGMTDMTVTVTTGTAAAGDISLAWDESLAVGEEGYVLDIDDVLSVTAPQYVGIVYAGATITQMLMSGSIPKGIMRDYPQYEVRSTMLDIARFYMPLSYLEEVTMYAAFFKLNEFHAHINDNNGEQQFAFRVESKLYPEINSGIPADEVYSQEDYKQYQKNVAKYGIDVVTEIDTPAHSRFVYAHDGSFMIDNNCIDLSNADAISFVKSLYDEFLDGEDPVFQSSKFNVGIDEYDYTYAEDVRAYMDSMAKYIAEKGLEPRMWCSLNGTTNPTGSFQGFGGTTPVTNIAVQHYYGTGVADVQTLLDGEYRIINNHSKYLYIVPVTENGCHDFMDMQDCYENWETGMMSRVGYSDENLQPGHPLLLGSETSIWYDDKVGCSEFDYFARCKDQVMLMAEKNWFGKNLDSGTYEDFVNRIAMVEAASPLANPARYIESQDDVIASYDFSQLSGTTVVDNSGNGYDAAVTNLSVGEGALALNGGGYVSLPFGSVGFPYSVDFTLSVTEAGENAVLFDGNDGTVYLNYDGTGKLGIERKGYRFVFDYVIPTGVALSYRMVCKDEATLLYVEDALVGEAQLYKTAVETDGSTSFVLPTERIGAGLTGQLYSLHIAKAELSVESTDTVTTDKTALQDCLAESIDLTPYSAETVNIYEQLLTMGKTVYADTGATQAKVDWIVSEIRRAKENLSLIHSVSFDRSICPHCGKTQQQIQWIPWSYGSGNSVPTGHYYLTEDVTLGGQVKIGQSESDTQDIAVDVVLDLNGYSISSATRGCFYVYNYSTLSVLDSVGGGTVSGGYATRAGSTIYVAADALLNLYGGTLTSSVDNSKNGGVIYASGGSAAVYGGMIYGGSGLNGGNVYVSNGTFTMKGGTVVGGTATTAGGNIYASNSTVEIIDGLITGGSCSDIGGNIAVHKSTLDFCGGTVREGYAVSGGNIGSSDASDLSISGGYITGGTAARYGGNLYVNRSSVPMAISGGTIDGDMRISATVTLSGAPVIGLGNSNGLDLQNDKTLDISGLDSGARIYIARKNSGIFTNGYDPAVHADCFYGAVRTSVSVDSTGELIATNGTTGYCPHCGEEVTWTPWTAVSGEIFTQSGHYYLTASNTSVTSQIKIGDNIAAMNAVAIDLSGMSLTSTKRVFYVNSSLALLDSAGNSKVTGASTSTGGVIYGAVNSAFDVYSGTLVYAGSESAAHGGVIRAAGPVTVYGGVINGSAVQTTANGAAVYVSGATLTMHSGRIIGGSANQGGSVYFGSDKKAFTMLGGTVTGGTSGEYGGNLYVIENAAFDMRGGQVTGGTGDSDGNNDYNADNVYIHSGGSMTMSGGYILGADSSARGNAVLCWTRAAVTLDGDAQIFNTEKSGNLYIASTGSLAVKESFRGTAYANMQAQHTPAHVYGVTLRGGGTVKDSTEGEFAGKLFLEGSYGEPRIFGTEDNTLVVAGAAVVNEGGSLSWCKDADAAAQLCAERQCARDIKLFAKESTISAEGTHTVDLNGKDLTVSGGQVFCFDTANADYETYGKAVVSDSGEIANVFATTVDGQTYYMLRDESGAYTFHKLGMQVSGVSVRPSAAGIYYNGTWQLDDLLKSRVRSYGIAVSLTDMPTADFDVDTLWTELKPDTLESGKSQTSVLIENILKTGAEDNDARGKDKIYAAAYVVLDDGTAEGCTVVTDTQIAYSLYDVMKLLDENAYTANQEALEAFYASWTDPMSTWDFTNIGKS